VLRKEGRRLKLDMMTCGFPGTVAAKRRPADAQNLTSAIWRSALENAGTALHRAGERLRRLAACNRRRGQPRFLLMLLGASPHCRENQLDGGWRRGQLRRLLEAGEL
jgi:hypothetical protein